MTPPRPAVTVDCYVRASALVEPVDATVERLRDYETRGVIDEFAVEAWPDEVHLAGDADDSVVARYDLFRTWADATGVDLDPAFTTRERTTLVSDESDTMLVLPVVCLAVHVDGKLASVVPHRTETTTYTVDDLLDDLVAVVGAATPEAPSTDGDSPAGSSDAGAPQRCPACGDALVTGQGLSACPSCDWSDVDAGTDDRAEAAPAGERVPADGHSAPDPDAAPDQRSDDAEPEHVQPP